MRQEGAMPTKRMLAATAVNLLFASFVMAQTPPAERLVDVSDGLQIALALKRTPALPPADDTATIIVFVPGVLGSKLSWDGYTYGSGAVDPKRLAFRADDPPKVSTLDAFELTTVAGLQRLMRRDVYGNSLEALKDLNFGRLVEEFSYDWRASIDDSAKALNTWLSRPALKGKRIVFIAHSMGGLVLWRWLHSTPPSSRPVNVRSALIAGTPLQGSCDAARMLVENYGPPRGAGGVETFGTYWMFGEAHAALLTFPSVFQLLPRFDSRRPCLSLQMGEQPPRAQNHHEPGLWLGSGRDDGVGLRSLDAKRLKEYASKVGMTVEEYERSVRSAIEAGERFRRDMNLAPPVGADVVLFYSDSRRMPISYLIAKVPDQGWFSVVRANQASEGGGDGRVLMLSAMNDGYGKAPSVHRFRLQEQHGTLIKDPELMRYLRDNVIVAAHAEEQFLALSKTLGDDIVRDGMRMRGIIFDPGVGFPTATADVLNAQRTIAEYNAETIAPGVKLKGDFLRAYATAQSNLYPAGSSWFGAALWESALLLEPDYASYKPISPLIRYRAASKQWDMMGATATRLAPLVGRKSIATENEATIKEVLDQAGEPSNLKYQWGVIPLGHGG
jgi:pimeloyl-ACP methyl ester carboxylesterase